MDTRPFWERKTLSQMSKSEWESLCDGCGRCCLVKLEDEDTGDVHTTRLACRLLDIGSCRCRSYDNRQELVDDCLNIDLKAVRTLGWLPSTCAYRRLNEGRGLSWWHPLVSGTRETVHEAGISVQSVARSEKGIREHNIARYIIPALPDPDELAGPPRHVRRKRG